MSKCIVAVAFGEKYEKMGDLMIESFLKYNKGWDAVRIYGNAIRVPVACMPNGNITPFNACEIGRWVAMRELLDKYDEVLYCDNNIRWYGKYKPLNASVVLSPHVITDKAKYAERNFLFWYGVFNEGIVYMKGNDGKKACDFVTNNVSFRLNHFLWDDGKKNCNSAKKGCIWCQEIQSYLPLIGLDCKIDGNAGNNVAFWNMRNGDRSVSKKDGKFVVECNGKEFPLVSFHFSEGVFDALNGCGDAVIELKNEYIHDFNEAWKRRLITMRYYQGRNGLKHLTDAYFPDGSNLVGLEIGSYQGESAETFINSGKFGKLYCIDAWTNGYDENDEASFSAVNAEKVFDERFKNENRIVKIKGFSTDVADMIPDNSLDFIYIDATHTYEGVKKDLETYYNKVKQDGVISGHDYNNCWSGVIRAVDEFFGHKPTNVYCDGSWAVRKDGKINLDNPVFSDVKSSVPTVLSLDESLDSFCNSEKTLIRFGDGEFNYIFDGINIFERKNERLRSMLEQILKSDDESIDIAIPNYFISNPKTALNREIDFHNKYSSTIRQYMITMNNRGSNLFSPNRKYLHQMMFLPYHYYNDYLVDIGGVFDRIKSVFKERKLLLVTGDPYFKDYKDNENIFIDASSFEIYETPSKLAFANYDKMLEDLKDRKDCLICMACGPCGKVLAYELQTKYGIRVIDTGHLMRDYHRFINKIDPFNANDKMYDN